MDPDPVTDGPRKIAAVYAPAGVERPQTLTIVQTDDFSPPAVHTVPLLPGVEQHPWLVTSAGVGSIAVTAERWLMSIGTATSIDFSRLLPGDLEHDAIVVYGISESVHGPQRITGVELSGDYEEWVPFRCFASWEEMDSTPESVLAYRLGTWDRNEQFVHSKSSYILTARWSEEPVRTESPNDLAGCCQFEALNTGFVAITGRTPPSEYPFLELPPLVHLSRNGLTWERVTVPTFYGGYEGKEISIWVCSVQSYENGVIIREAINDFLPHATCGDDTFWSADGDLTNWRKLLAPPPGYG
ncbi:hypothetical protein [Candidatus Poriferisodalis sp.]|uniref:hypothetical protein n=1 Tax=Candidatus Poriferisodalis sp. TaxID=3101277 RepID=UPI003B59FD76